MLSTLTCQEVHRKVSSFHRVLDHFYFSLEIIKYGSFPKNNQERFFLCSWFSFQWVLSKLFGTNIIIISKVETIFRNFTIMNHSSNLSYLLVVIVLLSTNQFVLSTDRLYSTKENDPRRLQNLLPMELPYAAESQCYNESSDCKVRVSWTCKLLKEMNISNWMEITITICLMFNKYYRLQSNVHTKTKMG